MGNGGWGEECEVMGKIGRSVAGADKLRGVRIEQQCEVKQDKCRRGVRWSEGKRGAKRSLVSASILKHQESQIIRRSPPVIYMYESHLGSRARSCKLYTISLSYQAFSHLRHTHVVYRGHETSPHKHQGDMIHTSRP